MLVPFFRFILKGKYLDRFSIFQAMCNDSEARGSASGEAVHSKAYGSHRYVFNFAISSTELLSEIC